MAYIGHSLGPCFPYNSSLGKAVIAAQCSTGISLDESVTCGLTIYGPGAMIMPGVHPEYLGIPGVGLVPAGWHSTDTTITPRTIYGGGAVSASASASTPTPAPRMEYNLKDVVINVTITNNKGHTFMCCFTQKTLEEYLCSPMIYRTIESHTFTDADTFKASEKWSEIVNKEKEKYKKFVLTIGGGVLHDMTSKYATGSEVKLVLTDTVEAGFKNAVMIINMKFKLRSDVQPKNIIEAVQKAATETPFSIVGISFVNVDHVKKSILAKTIQNGNICGALKVYGQVTTALREDAFNLETI